MNNYKWVDRRAYLFVLCYLIVFIGTLRIGIKAYIDGSMYGCLTALFVAVAAHIMSLPFWPLKIHDEEISIVSDKFPVLRRECIAFKDIKKIHITSPRLWDELASAVGSTYRWVRIETDDGKRYRNVLLSPKEFEQVINSLIEEGAIKREAANF